MKEPVKIVENTLWSKAAPIWMYVVLTILLVGVWANYVYTVIHLFKINKEGKELELRISNRRRKQLKPQINLYGIVFDINLVT